MTNEQCQLPLPGEDGKSIFESVAESFSKLADMAESSGKYIDIEAFPQREGLPGLSEGVAKPGVERGKPIDIKAAPQVSLTGEGGQAARLLEAGAPPPGAIPSRVENPEEALRLAAERKGEPLGPSGSGTGKEPPKGPRGGRQPELPGTPGRRPNILLGTARAAGDIVGFGLVRALQTSGDLSYFLRQGLILARHQTPAQWGRAFRAFFSEQYALEKQAAIEARPYNPRTIDLTSFKKDAKLVDREEDFMSNLAEKIPVIKQLVRGSQRAATVFINDLRSGTANAFARHMIRQGVDPHSAEFIHDLNTYGSFVNRATGRGNMGALESSLPLLNTIFYSARRNVGLVQAPGYLFNSSARVRMEVWKDFLSFFDIGLTTLLLADVAGADVGLIPGEADFGKIQVGNTRVDIWGGYQQMARTAYLIADGTLKGDEEQVQEASWRFLRNKLSPGGTAAVDITEGKTALGEPVSLTDLDEAQFWSDRVLPLGAQGLMDAWKEHSAEQFALAATGLLGTGVQTYQTLQEARDEEAISQFNKKYDDLKTSERDAVDNSPVVLSKKAERPPSKYQTDKEAILAPYRAEREDAERAFFNNELDVPLQDRYHDISLKEIGAKQALKETFKSELAKVDQDKFEKKLSEYYALERKNPSGSIDFDGTENARNTWLIAQDRDVQEWIADFEDFQFKKKSPLEQRLRKYQDAKEAAGYYEKGITQEQREKLDKDNPELDALSWYFSGGKKEGRPYSLQSAAAVDHALQMGVTGRPIYYQGLNRPIDQDSRDAWLASGKQIDNYANITGKFYDIILAREGINRKFDSFNEEQQALIKSKLSGRVSALSTDYLESSPDLNAWLVWWGYNIKLHTQESIRALNTIQRRYGNRPILRPDGTQYKPEMTTQLRNELTNG